jgi:hydrogenase nickel insertion protein HypA
MHELSIAQDLITTVLGVAEQNDAKQVTRAIVEIGALSGVEPDALTLAWEVVRQGTIAKDSPLEIEHKPLVARCPRCNWQGGGRKGSAVCSRSSRRQQAARLDLIASHAQFADLPALP